MAIYHLTIKSGSRAKGISAARKSDYICRENRYEKWADRCLYKTSGNLPRWAEDSRDFWRAADQYEIRDARLFVEAEFALPKELEHEGRVELAKQFTRDLTGDRLPYSLAIHEGKGHNPHAHLMISERMNDGVERPRELWFRRANTREPEHGGALKSRDFHGGSRIREIRELWAERANQAMEREGHLERVSHLSLEAQGFERTPTRHLGPEVLAMEERGIRTDRGHELVAEHLGREQLTRELEHLEQHLGVKEHGLEKVRQKDLGLEY